MLQSIYLNIITLPCHHIQCTPDQLFREHAMLSQSERETLRSGIQNSYKWSRPLFYFTSENHSTPSATLWYWFSTVPGEEHHFLAESPALPIAGPVCFREISHLDIGLTTFCLSNQAWWGSWNKVIWLKATEWVDGLTQCWRGFYPAFGWAWLIQRDGQVQYYRDLCKAAGKSSWYEQMWSAMLLVTEFPVTPGCFQDVP